MSSTQGLITILGTAGAALYREVKQASDSALGIPSQCIVAQQAGIGSPDPRGRLQVRRDAFYCLVVIVAESRL